MIARNQPTMETRTLQREAERLLDPYSQLLGRVVDGLSDREPDDPLPNSTDFRDGLRGRAAAIGRAAANTDSSSGVNPDGRINLKHPTVLRKAASLTSEAANDVAEIAAIRQRPSAITIVREVEAADYPGHSNEQVANILRRLKPGDNVNDFIDFKRLFPDPPAQQVSGDAAEDNQSPLAPLPASEDIETGDERRAPNQSVQSKETKSPAPELPIPVPPAPLAIPCNQHAVKLSEHWKKFELYAVKAGIWRKGTLQQTNSTNRLLAEAIGDKPLSAFTKSDAREFQGLLLALPARYGHNSNWISIRKSDGVWALKDAAEEALASGEEFNRLSFDTINRHFSALATIWQKAELHGELPLGTGTLFNGFFLDTDSQAAMEQSSRLPRTSIPDDKAELIFESSCFRGCASRHQQFVAGNYLFLDEHYWGLLALAMSGMRLEELMQLRVKHIVRDAASGIWYFDLTDPKLKLKRRAKTVAGRRHHHSERKVPLHHVLIELGFLDWRVTDRDGEELLFPECHDNDSRMRFGGLFGQWFSYHKPKFGLTSAEVLHSWHHGVATKLLAAGVPVVVVEQLLGEESIERSAFANYWGGTDLAGLEEAIRIVLLTGRSAILRSEPLAIASSRSSRIQSVIGRCVA